ncbi:hypothetical protein O7599_29795 [Streptomyces sp. WMMC500]|nr:hypothetical protein [Streptomyces sp. WMMC500]WBB64688.1 hypothetical protein O7599_29795 [Streptomyces sp. WMMC500]
MLDPGVVRLPYWRPHMPLPRRRIAQIWTPVKSRRCAMDLTSTHPTER